MEIRKNGSILLYKIIIFSADIKFYTLLFLVLLMPVLNCFANNYTVTTTADSHAANYSSGIDINNQISLRSALEAADKNGGTSTITVNPGTYTLTLGEITIGNKGQNITINGTDPSNTAVIMSSTSNTDRILFINSSGNTEYILITINNISFQGGKLNSDQYGGGAICAGGPFNSLTLNNCAFKSNTVPPGNGPGGAINFSPSGSLTISNCSFTSNTNMDSEGGAVYYLLQNNDNTDNGSLNITNSVFTGNSVTATGNGGGAIDMIIEQNTYGNTFNATIQKNSFVNNQAAGSGGAIKIDNEFASNNTITVNYNRFYNNTATSENGLAMVNSASLVDASNNWWGCNNGPSSVSGCNTAGLISGTTGLTTTPFLELTVTGNAASCVNSGSTVTASFLKNSAGNPISASNLSALIGLAISFSDTKGTLSNQQTTIQSNGTATATYTTQSTAATGTVNAVVDNVSASDNIAKLSETIYLPVVSNPVVSSDIVGTLFDQTFTESGGTGTITYSTTSALPNGITLSSGTGELKGTPTVAGTFPIIVNATDNNNCKGSGTTFNLVISSPMINETGTLSAFTTCPGAASSTQTFAVSGSNLTGNISITAPAGFEVSTSSTTGFANNISLTETSNTVSSTTIYSRLASSASGSPSGNIVCASTNASSVNVPISGTVNTTATWNGSVSSDFTNTANWTGCAPAYNIDVIITSLAPSPQLAGAASVNNITINSSATLTVTGILSFYGNSITNNGTFTATNGTIELKGSGAQTIPANTFNNNTIQNLKINNPAGVVLNGKLQVTGILNPIAGTLNTNGNLTLVSTATGTASISAGNGNYIIGSVTVQQYIPGGYRHYRFLGHPFSSTQPLSLLTNDIDITGLGGITNGFTPTSSNNPSAFFFNTANANGDPVNDGGWTAFTGTNGGTGNNWNTGEGIRVLVRGTKGQAHSLDGTPAGNGTGNTYLPAAVTLNMFGTVNTGNQNISLKTGGTGATAGFNFVGNPYPSPLDIGTVIYANPNITHTVYVRNPQTSSYTTVPISGVYSIPGNAAYFVQANSSTSLNFTESNKTSSSSGETVFGNGAENFMQFKITDTAGIIWDNLFLFFNSNNSAMFERGTDAPKLSNDVLNLYSISSDNQHLAIDYRNLEGSIPLGITTVSNTAANYIMSVTDYKMSNGNEWYLYDQLNKVYTPLSEAVKYPFTINGSDSTTSGNKRFSIVFNKAVSTITPDPSGKFIVNILGNPVKDNITIHYETATAGLTQIRLLSSNGQLLQTKNLGDQQMGNISIPVGQYAQGIYLIEVTIGNNTVIRKVMKE